MKKNAFIFSVLFLISQIVTSQTEFTNDIAFLAYLKINKIPLTDDENIKFLKEYHNEEYRNNSSDEFQLKDYLSKKKIELINSMDTLNLNNKYIYKTDCQLGDYNFEKKGFPLLFDKDLSDGYINPRNGWNNYDYVGKAINIDSYRFLPMEPEIAKSLLTQLKSKNNTDRILEVNIEISLSGKTEKYLYDQVAGIVYFTGYALCVINNMIITSNGINKMKL